MLMVSQGSIALLRWLLYQLGGSASVAGGIALIGPVAGLLVGLPLWVLPWRLAQVLFQGPDIGERESALRKFYLHAVVFGGPFWKRHIAFRDALRGNEQLAQQYWRLKQRLAARFPNDRAAYTDAKSEFIRNVLSGA